MSEEVQVSMRKRNIGQNGRVSRLRFWDYRKVEKRENDMDRAWFTLYANHQRTCALIGLDPTHSVEEAVKYVGGHLDGLARKKVRDEKRFEREKSQWAMLVFDKGHGQLSAEALELEEVLKCSLHYQKIEIEALGERIQFVGEMAHHILCDHFPWDKDSREQLFKAAKDFLEAEKAKRKKK
ncbi:MAG TPA: hypothetical protein VGE35_02095 [Candidatus Paceibacterota bacterium]